MGVIEDPPNPRCEGLARHYLTLVHSPSAAVVVDDAHMKPYNTTDDSALQSGICEVLGCGSSTSKGTALLCSEHHKGWRNSGTRKAGQRARTVVAETYRQWLLDVGRFLYMYCFNITRMQLQAATIEAASIMKATTRITGTPNFTLSARPHCPCT
jgi:hypothetical protein